MAKPDGYLEDGFVVDDAPKRRAPAELKGQSGGYAWEDKIKRPWEVVGEDEGGDIGGAVAAVERERRRHRHRALGSVQRGIIRALVLVVDLSHTMSEKDMRPNRAVMAVGYCEEFVGEFFDQNPISQLAIVAMRNGLASVVSPVSGDVQTHLECLRKLAKVDPEGGPSIQNALELARGLLLHVGGECMREIGVVYGSLTTTDPGNIHTTAKALAHESVAVRIVGLTARVAVCDEIAHATGGDYAVALDEHHFRQLVLDWVTPIAIPKDRATASLVRMGFPTRTTAPQLCGCHSELREGARYRCPHCGTLVCSVPLQCPCCGLTLVLSTHLARGFHHLTPLGEFLDIDPAGPAGPAGPAVRPLGQTNNSPLAANAAGGAPAAPGVITTGAQHAQGAMQGVEPTGGASSPSNAPVTGDAQPPQTHAPRAGVAGSYPETSDGTPSHSQQDATACFLCDAAPLHACPKCLAPYCGPCTDFLHASLHNCPRCESL